MEVVENQLRDNDPPETHAAYERLKGEGFSDLDAKKLKTAAERSERKLNTRYCFWLQHANRFHEAAASGRMS